MDAADTINIRYVFGYEGREPTTYDVRIERETLSLIPHERERLPDWTRLEHQQCEHCPLKPEDHEHCPVAANIAEVVEEFEGHTSYDPTTVAVITPERTYVKEVPLQYGIFSIMGLIMATSGCPHMDFLRPMARFHLPFANSTETIVRTVSMFLLRRYLEARGDKVIECDLSRLDEHYTAVNKVNNGIISRIRSLVTGDADVNAIVILHSLATMLSYSVSDDLSEIAQIFSAVNGNATS